MSAFMPTRSRPRSSSPIAAALSAASRLMAHDTGNSAPRPRSRVQWVSVIAGGGGVAHDADMGAAVAQADQRVGRGDHLAHHVEIAAGIVGDRQIEDPLAVALRAAGRRPPPRASGLRAPPGRRCCSRPSARSPADRRAGTCGPSARPAGRAGCPRTPRPGCGRGTRAGAAGPAVRRTADGRCACSSAGP